jgi:psp operon transcriptional activator
MTVEALGQSEAFIEFQEKISRVARVNRPVLLVGERGTGKELAATRIHFLSQRWQKPFITLNCAALSPTLIETELFGHERGAFTGAVKRRSGRFETANKGTFFLDEIGLIPMEVQEKILRVVEYGSFERVGGTLPVEVDVRIVGATNMDLTHLALKGEFKQDLLDRLSFEVLFLPPLRERHGDIMLLAHHFATRMAYELGRKETPEFSEDAVRTLNRHKWEGNIRELKNVVERAVYRSDSSVVAHIDFDPFHSPYQPESNRLHEESASEPTSTNTLDVNTGPLKDRVKAFEIDLIKNALASAKYNQKKAAGLLGLSYDQFRGKLRKYADDLKTS